MKFNSVYGWLNHEAKTWWANAGDRAKQHAQIRNAVKRWREAIVQNAFVKIGHGRTTLHGENWSVEGYDSFEGPTPQIAIRLGLPVIDLTTIPIAQLSPLTYCGPMAVVTSKADPAPWGGFSCAPISVMAALYASVGARVVNIDPDYARAKFTNFKMKPEIWAEIFPPKPTAIAHQQSTQLSFI